MLKGTSNNAVCMLILPTPEPHNPRTRLLVWFLFMKGFFEGLITVQFVHLYCGINDWHEIDFKGFYIFSSTPCFTCTVTKNCYWVSWQFFSGSNICSWNTGNSASKNLSVVCYKCWSHLGSTSLALTRRLARSILSNLAEKTVMPESWPTPSISPSQACTSYPGRRPSSRTRHSPPSPPPSPGTCRPREEPACWIFPTPQWYSSSS